MSDFSNYSSVIPMFKSDTKVRLIYFAEFRAKSEAILLMCAYRNCPVEQLGPDTVFGGEWPATRNCAPFGQLPILVLDDGTGLAQSYAIQKYLAKELNLVSSDRLVEAMADQTAQAGEELGQINPICNDLVGDEFKAAVKEFLDAELEEGCNGTTKIANLSKSLGDKKFFPGFVIKSFTVHFLKS